MAVLRELLAKFRVDFDDKELQKGAASIDGLADKIRNFAGVAAAVGLGTGIGMFIDSIRTAGTELDNVSKQLGLSTQALQEWRFVAADAGLDAGDVFGGFSAIADNAVQAASGSKDMADNFKKLGVEVKDRNGQFKDINTLLLEMADGFAKVTNETEKQGIAQTLAGDDGIRLLGVFAKQRKGIEALREQYRQLGGGLSTEVIDASKELTGELGKLSAVFNGVKNLVGLAVLPTLTRFFQRLTEGVGAFVELARGSRIVEAAIITLTAALTALGVRIAIAFAPALATFAAVSAAVAAVILTVDDLITLFEGGESVIGDFLDKLFGIGAAENVVQDMIALWERFVGLLNEGASLFQRFGNIESLLGFTGSGASTNTTVDNSRTAGPSLSQANQVTINATGADESTVESIRKTVTEALAEANTMALAALTGAEGA